MNSLDPGFIRIGYVSGGHPHTQTIPVRPYLAVDGTYWLQRRNDSIGALWTTIVDAYVNKFKPFINAASSITDAQLWTQATPTSVPVNVSNHAIAVAGTGSGGATQWCEAVLTFRTTLGGRMKMFWMEPITAVDLKIASGSLSSGAIADMRDYLLSSAGNFNCARDGSFPVACVTLITKTNDTLRKHYLRP